MQAYKRIATVDPASRLVLTNLPFRPGQRVEILVVSEEESAREQRETLKDLFGRTQSIPAARKVTDEEIRAEIEAVRNAS